MSPSRRQRRWSAVRNGVPMVPLLVVVMWLASVREIMGRHVIGTRPKLVGSTAVLVMAAAAVLITALLAG